MDVILVAIVVLASLLIIASGVWVGVALIRALSVPRRVTPPVQTRKDAGPA